MNLIRDQSCSSLTLTSFPLNLALSIALTALTAELREANSINPNPLDLLFSSAMLECKIRPKPLKAFLSYSLSTLLGRFLIKMGKVVSGLPSRSETLSRCSIVKPFCSKDPLR